MNARLLAPFLVLSVLPLSGCIVGDGIAHVVKMTQDSMKKGDSAASPEAAPAAAPARSAVRDEAPPPAAAPSRSSVSVETLAPPAH